MSYLGDISLGGVLDHKFTTVNSSGAPVAFLAGDCICWKGAATSQSSTAGITVTSTFGSITGLNHLRILTTADTSFYAGGNNFTVTVSTGAGTPTINGNTVTGYTVCAFSILNRSNPSSTDYTAARAANLDATISSRASSTSIPANLQYLTVSSSAGTADADLREWLGVAPTTYTTWLSSTEKPTNWSNLVVSTSGIVDANLQQWRSGVPGTTAGPPGSTDYTTARAAKLDNLDAAVSTRPSSTDYTSARATKLDNLDAAVSSRSTVTTAQVNAEVVDGLATDLYAEPSSAPASSNASLKDRIVWMSALTLQSLDQNSTSQSLINSSSGATAVATAVIAGGTSGVRRSAWL